MKKLFSISILIFHLSSCSSNQKEYKKVAFQEIYRSSGGGEYVFRPIENWLNFDSSSECFRSKQIAYFDFIKIKESFNIDYATAVKWQWQYNQQPDPDFDKDLFFESLEIAKKKRNLFNLPSYSKVAVYNLSASSYKKPSRSLLKFLKYSLPKKGIPIIHSHCFSTKELEEWGERNRLEDTWYIGNEIGNTFSKDFKSYPGWKYPFESILKGKKILFIRN